MVTRWGSWINCAAFLCENYDKIKSFLDELPDDSKACEISKRLVNDEIVKDELFNCTVYKFLVSRGERHLRFLVKNNIVIALNSCFNHYFVASF